MSGNFSVTFHSYLKSKQFLKNYTCSLVLKVIRIRKSGAVPSHIISSSDVVTAGWTIGILLKSCISGHVFICKSYCLAVIITIRCTGSCNLASCIRSGMNDRSCLVNKIQDHYRALRAFCEPRCFFSATFHILNRRIVVSGI